MATISSLSTIATDPLRNFKFRVIMDQLSTMPGGSQMGFMDVSGLVANTSPIEYREGGNNTTTRKMPGQTLFQAVTFRRGVIVGTPWAYQWFQQIFDVVSGRGGFGNNFRSTAYIDVLDHPISQGDPTVVRARVQLYNVWPSSIQYSDLDAGGNGIFIETMVLEHEGFTVQLANPGQALAV